MFAFSVEELSEIKRDGVRIASPETRTVAFAIDSRTFGAALSFILRYRDHVNKKYNETKSGLYVEYRVVNMSKIPEGGAGPSMRELEQLGVVVITGDILYNLENNNV